MRCYFTLFEMHSIPLRVQSVYTRAPVFFLSFFFVCAEMLRGPSVRLQSTKWLLHNDDGKKRTIDQRWIQKGKRERKEREVLNKLIWYEKTCECSRRWFNISLSMLCIVFWIFRMEKDCGFRHLRLVLMKFFNCYMWSTWAKCKSYHSIFYSDRSTIWWQPYKYVLFTFWKWTFSALNFHWNNFMMNHSLSSLFSSLLFSSLFFSSLCFSSISVLFSLRSSNEIDVVKITF